MILREFLSELAVPFEKFNFTAKFYIQGSFLLVLPTFIHVSEHSRRFHTTPKLRKHRRKGLLQFYHCCAIMKHL